MTTVATSTGSQATAYSGQGHGLLAPGGVGGSLHYDGSTWQLSKAASPLTSWSSVTAITNSVLSGCLGGVITAAGDIHVVYKRPTGPWPSYRKLTFGSGTWTLGSEVAIASSGDFANDSAPADISLDAFGRIWVHMSEWVGGYATHIYHSLTGSTWTDYQSGPGGIHNQGHCRYIKRAFSGGTEYMVFALTDGGDIRWQRSVVTSGSVGAMSTQQQLTGTNMHNDHSGSAETLADGRILLCVCASFGNEYAVRTYSYNPATDAWTSRGDIGTNNTDRSSCVIVNPTTSTAYCVWSEFAASGSYAIVYKEYDPTTNTWGSKQTIQAAGKERIFINGFCDGTTLFVTCTNVTDSIVESFTVTVGTSGPATAVAKRWDGSAWQTAVVKRWDGSAWQTATTKRY